MSEQFKTEFANPTGASARLADTLRQLGMAARQASRLASRASTEQKNAALRATAEAIESSAANLKSENDRDLEAGRRKGLTDAMLDRLTLSDKTISTMVEGLEQVASLPDPVGQITDLSYQPSGIQVGKMRVPLGVIGIIYESRPNVTIEAGSLCLKSGNAAILRGGSEAIYSNSALAACMQQGLISAGLPAEILQLVATTDRAAVTELVRLNEYVDVIVPRGGKGLIELISREASIPVIKHLDGICHVYLDDAADTKMALDIAINAKTQRYAVCNSMETLLVAESRAGELLPLLASAFKAEGVEMRGCPATKALLGDQVTAATDEDWQAEYLAPILAIKVVTGLDEAIAHINQWGSAHTDAIVTEHYERAMAFLRQVDSSSVMVNTSPRFADGFEYGLGAEIGISTDKLHARGPVGLEGLTSQKFVVLGHGQIRS